VPKIEENVSGFGGVDVGCHELDDERRVGDR
jgi:hypothetical protein